MTRFLPCWSGASASVSLPLGAFLCVEIPSALVFAQRAATLILRDLG